MYFKKSHNQDMGVSHFLETVYKINLQEKLNSRRVESRVERERPRRQSRKTLSSLVMSTLKSHLSAEQPLMKKTGTY